MNLKRTVIWGGSVLAVLMTAGCPGPVEPPPPNSICPHPGELSVTITTEMTVGETCSNWVVRQGVTVGRNGRVIIKPGTTLTFSSGAGIVVDGGSLTAEGTADHPILLTGAQKTRGFWQGVSFHNTNSVQNVLKYVTVEFAGSSPFTYASVPAAVSLTVNSDQETSRVAMDYVILSDSKGYGLHLGDRSLVTSFTANALVKNASGAADVVPDAAGFLKAGNNTYTGNDVDRVTVHEGTLRADAQWSALGVPYRLQNLWVEANLAIAPGAVLEFASGTGVVVQESGATLKAEGTATQPILFSGQEKTRGFWRGLNFHNSNGVLNSLKYVTVEYAGSSPALYAEDSAAVALTTNSDTTSTRVTIAQSTFQQNKGYGLVFDSRSTMTGFEGNTLTKNTVGAAAGAANGIHHLLATSTYTGNDTGKDLVTVYDSPTVNETVTWQGLGVPFRLKYLRVEAPGHLTLQAGVRMEFDSGGSFIVDDAQLTAVGTADKRIVLTKSPVTGTNWMGLNFHNTDSVNNRLEYVDISSGGSVAQLYADSPALLAITSNSDLEFSSVTLAHVRLSSTSGHGIWVNPDMGSVRGCTDVTFTGVSTNSNTTGCQ